MFLPSPNLKQKQTNKTGFPNKLTLCCSRSLCKVYGGKQHHACYLNSEIHPLSSKGKFDGSTYTTFMCMSKLLPCLETDQGIKSEGQFLGCFDVTAKAFAVSYLL